MRIPVVIPFKPKNAKTRLSDVLNQTERECFAAAMLLDVLDAVKSAGCEPLVLSTTPCDLEEVNVCVLEEGLNETINRFCEGRNGPLAIVMADLALADRPSILSLLTSGADLALVPGRGGGTNAVYTRSAQSFQAQYYGMSFCKHLKYGRDADMRVKVIDSFRLYSDIDESDDLVEVLIHNTGQSKRYLEGIGFSIEVGTGRIGVHRKV